MQGVCGWLAAGDATHQVSRLPRSYPFKQVCLPLIYSGISGVNEESYRGVIGKRTRESAKAAGDEIPPEPRFSDSAMGTPFKPGCLPLSYSGNPGVNLGFPSSLVRAFAHSLIRSLARLRHAGLMRVGRPSFWGAQKIDSVRRPVLSSLFVYPPPSPPPFL